MNIRKQMGKIYLFDGLLCLRITNVIWVLILLQRGFSLAQVGIAEGVFHVASMICEIPTGMAADVFGRKGTLMLSGMTGVISCILMGFGNWEGWIYLGMIFSALNFNLASGTEEAMVYDSLLQKGLEEEYKQKKFRLRVIGDICSSVGCLIGPMMLFMGYRNIYGICAIMGLCTVFLAWTMEEPVVTELQKKRQENPFSQIGLRMKNHVQDTFAFMREHPRTICKLFGDAAVACPTFLTMMYLQQHLVDCGLPEAWIGVPMLLIPLGGTLGSWIASKSKVRLFPAIMICGVVGGVGTCLAGSSWILLSIVGAVCSRICEGYSELAVSESANAEFSSDQRATMVSVDCMFYSILMVIASPFTGFLGEHLGMSQMFAIFGGILVVMTPVAGFWYRRWSRK